MKKTLSVFFIVVIGLLGNTGPVCAAYDMIIRIEGVEGESKVADHEDEIDVLAWSWGMTQPGSMHDGTSSAGRAKVHDIVIRKYIDKSTPHLMRAVLDGKHFDEATLTMRKSGETPVDFLSIRMSQVLVTSVSTDAVNDDSYVPTETITLNFAKLTVSYTPQREDGSPEAKIDLTWDIQTNAEE